MSLTHKPTRKFEQSPVTGLMTCNYYKEGSSLIEFVPLTVENTAFGNLESAGNVSIDGRNVHPNGSGFSILHVPTIAHRASAAEFDEKRAAVREIDFVSGENGFVGDGAAPILRVSHDRVSQPEVTVFARHEPDLSLGDGAFLQRGDGADDHRADVVWGGDIHVDELGASGVRAEKRSVLFPWMVKGEGGG